MKILTYYRINFRHKPDKAWRTGLTKYNTLFDARNDLKHYGKGEKEFYWKITDHHEKVVDVEEGSR